MRVFLFLINSLFDLLVLTSYLSLPRQTSANRRGGLHDPDIRDARRGFREGEGHSREVR